METEDRISCAVPKEPVVCDDTHPMVAFVGAVTGAIKDIMRNESSIADIVARLEANNVSAKDLEETILEEFVTDAKNVNAGGLPMQVRELCMRYGTKGALGGLTQQGFFTKDN